MNIEQLPKEFPQLQPEMNDSAVYDYRDRDSNLLYQVVRTNPKGFYQRRLVSEGHFAYGLKESWYALKYENYHKLDVPADPDKRPSGDVIWLDKVEPTLYNLPVVIAAIKNGETIHIVEGEKDCDNLNKFGYIATTNSGGAGKWQPSLTELLKGCKDVVIIAHKDKAGRDHAEAVATELSRIDIHIKVIEMPDREDVKIKDFTDWVSAGGTKEEFDQIVANAPDIKVEVANNGVCDDDIDKKLVDSWGEPYYFNKHGEVIAINESLFAALYNAENIIIYDPIEKAFYRYDDKTGLYSEITENIIKKEIADRILQISREQNLPSLERMKKNSVLINVIGQLKGIAEKRNAFVKDRLFIHLENGILIFNDANEADFVNFSPIFFSRNQCPIRYDPKAKCDRFLNELLYPAVHKDDIGPIQKYCGLCLLGINLIQKILILDGEPERGKTTIANIVQRLIGLVNVTELRTQHLIGRFELFRYLKKTLLVGVDVPGNFLSQKGTHIIKGLVGGDYFDAEQKCGTSSFQLQGRHCVLITSNSRLQIKLDGDIGAWRRRLLIVRFNGPIPVKKISDFSKQLIKEEGSGILNWALAGLKMLRDDMDRYGEIQLGERQYVLIDALLAESESIRHFLVDSVVMDEDSDLSFQEIIERYAAYCLKKGWVSKPITIIPRELEALMLELFHTSKAHSVKRDGKWLRGYHRVRFKDEEAVNGPGYE